MRKAGVEFGFGWMFAIIVGAVIIALAIYGVTSFVKVERTVEDSSKSVEIASLLKQLETGLEEQGTAKIDSKVKTRITNGCTLQGGTVSERTFGIQSIKTAISSGIGKEEWSDSGIAFKSESIYLFTNKTIEGKSFMTLSKRFEYPYKVADIIMMWPSTTKICFVNAPDSLKSEIDEDKIGINFSTSTAKCPQASMKVCFAQAGCDVEVSQGAKTVKKDGKIMHYDQIGSALFYGAIFSDPEIYECQIKRLAKKASVLGGIYSEKSRFGAALGCSADALIPLIDSLTGQLDVVENSDDFAATLSLKEELGRSNDALICPLF